MMSLRTWPILYAVLVNRTGHCHYTLVCEPSSHSLFEISDNAHTLAKNSATTLLNLHWTSCGTMLTHGGVFIQRNQSEHHLHVIEQVVSKEVTVLNG